MNRKKLIIGGAVALGILLLIGVTLYIKSRKEEPDTNPSGQEVSMDDPVDIALDFYNTWREMVTSTTTDPYTSGLATKGILGEELRNRLSNTEERASAEIDPVLCQSVVPQRVTARVVSEYTEEVQVLITAKEKEMTGQAVYKIARHNDGWFIKDIECSPGEFGTTGEFSFEREGHLLKNVPAPFDSKYWHIVFEDDGQRGHVAPLFFDNESVCIATDKKEGACMPDQFKGATRVRISGEMTETGVKVTKLEFLE